MNGDPSAVSEADARAGVVTVDDPDDPRLADYRHLTDASLRAHHESAAPGHPGVCIAESRLVVATALRSGHRLRSVLVTPAAHAALAGDLEGFAGPVYVAPRNVMSAVAGFPVHRGALASVERPPLPAPAALLAAHDRIAVLEGVSDHENLGLIFRTAAAFGIGAVLLSPTSGDPLYRRSLRVSMGHALRVPFTRLTPWPDSLDDARGAGFTVIALTPRAGAESIRALDVSSLSRVAVVLGAEGDGITPAALGRADRYVRIPMAPGVDSLNVATAAAVAFHHVAGLA